MTDVLKSMQAWRVGWPILPLMLAGCAGALMQATPVRMGATPDAALVTILPAAANRTTALIEIWLETNLVGVVTEGDYIQCALSPGAHTIMAKGENWSCVQATVTGGRRYTLMAQLAPGTFRARVALEPMTQSDYANPETVRRIDVALRALTPRAPAGKRLAAFAKPKQSDARVVLQELEAGRMPFKTLNYDDYRR